MTTELWVGTSSAGAANGSSWDNRYGSLSACEAKPVVANTLVHVQAGVYRETLTCGVSGTAGNTIEYRGDYTGQYTDGVGGVVRITGSDNDITATRTRCIYVQNRNYRTFQGFLFDLTTTAHVGITTGTNCIVQNCVFRESAGIGILVVGNNSNNHLFQNNLLAYLKNGAINLTGTSASDNCNIVIQNNIVLGVNNGNGNGLYTTYYGGWTAKNNAFVGCYFGTRALNVSAAQVNTSNNNIYAHCYYALYGSAATDITDDYNAVFGSATAYTQIVAGTHSNAYPPLFDVRWFFDMVLAGGRMLTPFDLGQWSQLINLAGTSPTGTDMRGTGTIGAQREWGALEYDTTLQVRPNVLNNGVVGQGIMRSSQW